MTTWRSEPVLGSSLRRGWGALCCALLVLGAVPAFAQEAEPEGEAPPFTGVPPPPEDAGEKAGAGRIVKIPDEHIVSEDDDDPGDAPGDDPYALTEEEAQQLRTEAFELSLKMTNAVTRKMRPLQAMTRRNALQDKELRAYELGLEYLEAWRQSYTAEDDLRAWRNLEKKPEDHYEKYRKLAEQAAAVRKRLDEARKRYRDVTGQGPPNPLSEAHRRHSRRIYRRLEGGD